MRKAVAITETDPWFSDESECESGTFDSQLNKRVEAGARSVFRVKPSGEGSAFTLSGWLAV